MEMGIASVRKKKQEEKLQVYHSSTQVLALNRISVRKKKNSSIPVHFMLKLFLVLSIATKVNATAHRKAGTRKQTYSTITILEAKALLQGNLRMPTHEHTNQAKNRLLKRLHLHANSWRHFSLSTQLKYGCSRAIFAEIRLAGSYSSIFCSGTAIKLS